MKTRKAYPRLRTFDPPAPPAAPERVAYSYLRFSSPRQADGDSERRQVRSLTVDAEAWCGRNGVRLDVTKRMEDRGLSAADGTHIRRGALGQFLGLVAAGDIAEGSVLIVETLSRLSRENPWDAVPMLCEIVNAGITVVVLAPTEMVFDRNSGNVASLIYAVVGFDSSNRESKDKSKHLRDAWGEKKRLAREEGVILTGHYPDWLALDAETGELAEVKGRADAIRRMFALAAGGLGVKAILCALEAEGFKPWGYSGKWARSYIYQLLKSRTVLGEYQPHRLTDRGRNRRKGRTPDGDPIPGHYPAVVDETTWNRAQAAIASRYVGGRPKGGRVGRVPDLFTGMIRDAGNGCKMHTVLQTRGKPGRQEKRRVIAPADACEGRIKMVTLPYRVFESAVLAKFKEVTAAEVLGEEPKGESAAIAGQVAAKKARLALITNELAGDGGDVAELAEAARRVRHEKLVLERKLREAQGREANPRAEALAQAQTLADVAADPQSRLRLRTLLQNVLEPGIDVLIVPRRALRLVAVQINFAGGAYRNYLIEYRPAGNGRAEILEADTFTGGRARLDLRTARDVATMRRILESVHDALDAGEDRPAL